MNYAIEILEREERRLSKRIEKTIIENELDYTTIKQFKIKADQLRLMEILEAVHKLKGEE